MACGPDLALGELKTGPQTVVSCFLLLGYSCTSVSASLNHLFPDFKVQFLALPTRGAGMFEQSKQLSQLLSHPEG